jgi:hypothetical protein
MNLLSRKDLQELIDQSSDVCVSILMPTHRGSDARQDPIRLRNSIQRAQDRLLEMGMRTSEAAKLLEPVSRLLLDAEFWRNQGAGLAIYVSQEIFRVYRLPLNLPDIIGVNGRFQVRPLLPLFTDGLFYVLVVSQNQIRLLQSTRLIAREVPLEGTRVPGNLAKALKYDVHEKALQFHTQTSTLAGGRRRAAIFHGHGGFDKSVHKDDLVRFLQQVARGVREILAGEQAPLVLAGVDYLHAIFRQVNTYPGLVEQGLPGNLDRAGDDELREKAWEIVQPHFLRAQEEATAQFGRSASLALASDDLAEVVRATCAGRVGVLFAGDSPQWGRYDMQADTVDVHPARQEGDDDLCDLAAYQTLRHGGLVYAGTMDRRFRPSPKPLAAIYRY